MSQHRINDSMDFFSGEKARLIPVVSDTSREKRTASVFLAGFMTVREYARSLLGTIGVRLGKTATIECFTEVVFKGNDQKIRPDGLIVIKTGQKIWKALVEVKIGRTDLKSEQVESYLGLARKFDIDAIITISNQFANNPKTHPIAVSKSKLKNLNLYHWSWTFLLTEAIMWINYHEVSDPERCYLLEELIRFMQHDSSGVVAFSDMKTSWKDTCLSIQNRLPVDKNSVVMKECISSWHQLVRYLSLKLGIAIGKRVNIIINRKLSTDPEQRLQNDMARLLTGHKLKAVFEIPNAASRICLIADIDTKNIHVSMKLDAPGDKKTNKGRVNWLLHQLKKCPCEDAIITVFRKSKKDCTFSTLKDIKEMSYKILLGQDNSSLPTSFEIVTINNLGRKFQAPKCFVQEIESAFIEFYKNVGQHLRAWVPYPPAIEDTSITEQDTPIQSQDYTVNSSHSEKDRSYSEKLPVSCKRGENSEQPNLKNQIVDYNNES